jgi:hypothetical protein
MPSSPNVSKEAAVTPTPVPSTKQSWLPTKKWYGALAGGVASIVAVWIQSGSFDGTEKGMAATLIVALVAAYFKENDPTPGGVPTA